VSPPSGRIPESHKPWKHTQLGLELRFEHCDLLADGGRSQGRVVIGRVHGQPWRAAVPCRLGGGALAVGVAVADRGPDGPLWPW